MISFSRAKFEAATIRRIFQGEPEAYRLIIEQYQPLVYAIALAHTGNVYLADKAVVTTFEEGYGRLVSLTDARKLGVLFGSLAQNAAEQLATRRVPNWNKLRQRTGEAPVDLKWVQTELIEPLGEELGSFTPQERKGLLLHAFCGLSVAQIADILKIEKKEASEDLARTEENVEKALLKEITKALDLEINNKERMLYILSQVGGAEVVAKADRESRIGKAKSSKVIPITIALSVVLVVGIAAFFGYRAFTKVQVAGEGGVSSGGASETEPAASEGDTESVPAILPSNYVLQGRVVDDRFVTDGVTGLTVEASGRQAETDFYGSFEIRGVARGQHDVVVRSGGTVIKDGIRMHTEQHNDPITIAVDENVPARFLLQGRVFDRMTGQTLTRFEVTACKDFPEMMHPYILRRFREQQSPEGLLRDRFVTLGDYTMYVRAPGYAPLPVQFTIDENWTGQRIFEFPLYKATGFVATVYGANELSVSGAALIPRQGSASALFYEVFDYGKTNSMGRIELDSLPVGIQSFLVTHLQHGAARAIVELEPGKTTEIRVQFPRRGALTGDITLAGRPIRFREFRRRLGGSSIDLTKSVNYLSSGQYEIVLTPEPATIVGIISPNSGDRWFERRMEHLAAPSMTEPTWLDYNFPGGRGVIEGNISVQRLTANAIFVEVTYLGDKSSEHICYTIPSSGSFKLENLPAGKGEMTVYASARSLEKSDFYTARAIMEKQTKPFNLEDSQGFVYLDFSL